MKEIPVSLLKETVRDLILEANYVIPKDILDHLIRAEENETSPSGRFVLRQIIENDRIAADERIAICQDTGMAVFFFDIGQDVHFSGGDFTDAVNEAVAEAYTKGYLRKSIVSDPVFGRVNTRDNTPAVIHTRIVPGDRVGILFIAKGFGSENMSRIKMLPPAAGRKGVLDFIVETAVGAGPNACPPIIVGVGVGGDFESAAMMAKRMISRPVGSRNDDPAYALMESEAMERINSYGIGPAGIGGLSFALTVNIDHAPTHIAGLPVAVNICCHASRHAHRVL